MGARSICRPIRNGRKRSRFALDAVTETQRALAGEKIACDIITGAETGTFAIEAASGV
jgi:hypothetical protein